MEPKFDHIKIRLDDYSKGTIEINGHEVKSTVGMSMTARAGLPPIVSIHFLADVEIEVNGKLAQDGDEAPISDSDWLKTVLTWANEAKE